MYTTILTLHSWVRWLALIAGVAATIATLGTSSAPAAPPVKSRADVWGLILMIALDTQLLLGLLLYFFVSPNMAEIRANMGAAMRDPASRFWAVEHVTMMLGAIVVAHVGRVLGRKATSSESKRMTLRICFGLATVLMVLGMPWPGMRAGRPLFRGL